MRKLLLILTITIFTFGFTSKPSGKEYDKRLVGYWKGFEKDKQIEGVEKHWIQERFADGTYVIIFTSIENCEVQTFIEKGNWWTEKGKFYEHTKDGKDTDVYDYEIVDNLVVKFKSITLLGKADTTYNFEDYRIE